jgi:hypothetical protein
MNIMGADRIAKSIFIINQMEINSEGDPEIVCKSNLKKLKIFDCKKRPNDRDGGKRAIEEAQTRRKRRRKYN